MQTEAAAVLTPPVCPLDQLQLLVLLSLAEDIGVVVYKGCRRVPYAVISPKPLNPQPLNRLTPRLQLFSRALSVNEVSGSAKGSHQSLANERTHANCNGSRCSNSSSRNHGSHSNNSNYCNQCNNRSIRSNVGT